MTPNLVFSGGWVGTGSSPFAVFSGGWLSVEQAAAAPQQQQGGAYLYPSISSLRRDEIREIASSFCVPEAAVFADIDYFYRLSCSSSAENLFSVKAGISQRFVVNDLMATAPVYSRPEFSVKAYQFSEAEVDSISEILQIIHGNNS